MVRSFERNETNGIIVFFIMELKSVIRVSKTLMLESKEAMESKMLMMESKAWMIESKTLTMEVKSVITESKTLIMESQAFVNGIEKGFKILRNGIQDVENGIQVAVGSPRNIYSESNVDDRTAHMLNVVKAMSATVNRTTMVSMENTIYCYFNRDPYLLFTEGKRLHIQPPTCGRAMNFHIFQLCSLLSD